MTLFHIIDVLKKEVKCNLMNEYIIDQWGQKNAINITNVIIIYATNKELNKTNLTDVYLRRLHCRGHFDMYRTLHRTVYLFD